ncbi:MAG: aminoacyl-tRNA hydrolase [Deltaproteobacteria bacterium]|nr:aminoacyl-tRNA hydrolase [Deltaproteobacteria bacterium]
MSEIKIIAGLGNPGPEYESTRHNIGFLLLDRLLSPGESWKEKGGALQSELRLGSHKLLLVKPYTFMNLSGEPLGAIMKYYRYEPSELVVVQDDIDLPAGKIRLRLGGGDGGHNGIRSITRHLGSSDFLRLKLGVGKPDGDLASMDISDWVLKRYNSEELVAVDDQLRSAEQVLETLIKEGLVAAQNKI